MGFYAIRVMIKSSICVPKETAVVIFIEGSEVLEWLWRGKMVLTKGIVL